MYKEILRSIAGIGLFPVVSLVMFVAVFAVVLFRVMRMDRSDAQRFAGMPLDELDRAASVRQEVCR